jgi:CHAT domain-containing protein/lipopolysaccharide biosynthesis regulator YciM
LRLLGTALALGLCCAPAWGQASLPWIEQAQQAEDAGRYGEAGQAWEKAAAALSQEGNPAHRAKALFYAGLAHYRGGSKEAAVAQLTLGVEAFLALGDGEGQSLCLLQRGVVEIELARWTDAERSFRSAIEVSRRTGNESRALEATEFLGKTLEAGRRWAEATEVSEELVAAYRQSAPEKVPELMATLGALYQLQSQLEKAEEAYQQAAALYSESGKAAEAQGARRDLARFFLKTHQLEKAQAQMAALTEEGFNDVPLTIDHAYTLAQLGRHEQALALIDMVLPKTKDDKLLAVVKARRVEELVALKRDQEALKYLSEPAFGSDQARAQAAEAIGKRELAEKYLRQALAAATPAEQPSQANLLAIKLIRWDKPAQAAALLEDVLAKLPADDKRRAVLLSNLGETYLSRGEPSKALPIYQEVLTMTRQGIGQADLAVVLTNLGATYEYLGDYSQALKHLEEAIEVGERFKTSGAAQGTVYNSLGLVYVKMGRYKDGVTFYERGIAYHRTHGNSYGETASLINLGAAYQLLDNDAKAAEYLTQALAIAQRDGRLAQQITILNNLGQLAKSTSEAQDYYQRALELEASAPQALTRNILLSNLADSWYSSGRTEEAEKLATEASDKLRELGAKENELVTRRILLRASLSRSDSAATNLQLDRALELAQDIVAGLSSASARSFLAEHESVLREGLELVLKDGASQRAFAIDELLRSLGLAALTNGLPLQSAHLPVELVEREKTLLARMREASLRSADLSGLRAEHRLLVEQMERHHRAAGALHSTKPAALKQVTDQLAPDEAMLGYLLAGPDLWAIVIAKETTLRKVGALEDLEPLIDAAYRRVTSPTRPEQTQAALQALSDALWRPTQDLLAGKTRLILVPAGPLYSVPFAALVQDKTTLAERYRLTQVSSASAWLLSRQSTPSGKGALLAALGNFAPPLSDDGFVHTGPRSSLLVALPGTLAEVLKIAPTLKATETLKEQAMTGDALRQGSLGRRQLHYATHGLLNGDEPMLSGLVASDRLVTAAEIFNWELDADLAVLSACHSGQVSQGWEYVSLTRAFQFAGARTLLATNWAVSDQATAEWMETFYAALASGQPADQASQQAYLSLRQKYPHPYYWAPFALWGDGSVTCKSAL